METRNKNNRNSVLGFSLIRADAQMIENIVSDVQYYQRSAAAELDMLSYLIS